MAEKTFYITTPIYYVNDYLHIGHAYTTVAADVMARYKRMQGFSVMFVTGTDEHGQKIEKAALEQGEKPIDLADRIASQSKKLWKRLHADYDDFIRTTQPRHEQAVKELVKRIWEAGDIYKGYYEGWYCSFEESYYTETQLGEGQTCPVCGRQIDLVKEESYFFRMSKYADKLLAHIQKNPDFIQPESRKNEVVSFISSGLRDLSITRTAISWGVPFPYDDKHVIYVWLDALTNYLTAVGFGSNQTELKKYWPANVHLVGKDILRFHAIYWPCFLLSAELELPKQIFAHGWWRIEGVKMSKSLGNVIDPNDLIDEFGSDVLRYFLLREVPFGLDGDFVREALINRFNSDLANDLGNLAQRILTMVCKYTDGKVPQPSLNGGLLPEAASEMLQKYNQAMDKLAFSQALTTLWEFIGQVNRYIVTEQPWLLYKEKKSEKLHKILYELVEALRLIDLCIYPFMPITAEKLWKQLGFAKEFDFRQEISKLEWGYFPTDQQVLQPEALFPRLEKEKASDTLPRRSLSKRTSTIQEVGVDYIEKEKEMSEEDYINIEDFAKIRLKIGLVLEACRVPNSKKLIQMTVDTGDKKRSLVAGIGNIYTPEELVGKQIVVLTNLKPAKLMGVLSEGMLMAAEDNGEIAVLTVEKPLSPGASIR